MAKDKRPPSSNYRKPPVEYQFKKGQSGNPKGRPKKKKAIGASFGAPGGVIADRFGSMVLEEATKLVTVREDGKDLKIPAMQALIRTMLRSATQGDTKVGGKLLDVIARAESARAGDAQEFAGYMVRHKERYGPIFEECEREGRDPPDIYPRPDDIIFDETTGMVTVDGPMTKEEAGARKAYREYAIKSLSRYGKVAAALKKEPDNLNLKREFKALELQRDLLEEFLKIDAVRNARHRRLQLSRRALQKPEAEDDVSDQ